MLLCHMGWVFDSSIAVQFMQFGALYIFLETT